MSEMRVVGVRVELPANQPILLLRETSGDRYLPIWIGSVEATAIALEQQGVKPARPLTHDLLKNTIQELGGEVQDVVINNLMDHTYYAIVRVRSNGAVVEIDSRPSDAIALSVHYDPVLPIYVEDTVLGEVA